MQLLLNNGDPVKESQYWKLCFCKYAASVLVDYLYWKTMICILYVFIAFIGKNIEYVQKVHIYSVDPSS